MSKDTDSHELFYYPNAGIHVSETAFIISTVIMVAIGLWLFAVSYVTIFARIIDMLESGHVQGDVG